MIYYTFYDTNIFGDCNEELDIVGEDYKELLKICFEHCSCFSFMIFGEFRAVEKSIPEDLSEYEIEPEANVLDLYTRYVNLPKVVRCYTACAETYNSLLKINNSIFGWINDHGTNKKPEDLVFFREDGSVFMHCIAHDGECSLYPHADEDIRSVLTKSNWYIVDSETKSITQL